VFGGAIVDVHRPRLATNDYDTSQVFCLKIVFKSKTFDVAYTHAHKCLLLKVTFTNRTSSIPESFLSHMVSCDWPVRTWKHTTLLITNMERSRERWSDEKIYMLTLLICWNLMNVCAILCIRRTRTEWLKHWPSPIIRHFNLQLSCYSFQVCHVALVKITCTSNFLQQTFRCVIGLRLLQWFNIAARQHHFCYARLTVKNSFI